MEAIASDATRLIPLLQAGGDGFKRLGEEAAEAGRIMDEATIEALKHANERIDKFTQRATIAIGAVLAAVFGDEKSKLEKQAAKELLEEGKIKRKVRGGSKQDKERKKLIDDRVNAIKEENKEAEKAAVKKQIEITKERQNDDMSKDGSVIEIAREI